MLRCRCLHPAVYQSIIGVCYNTGQSCSLSVFTDVVLVWHTQDAPIIGFWAIWSGTQLSVLQRFRSKQVVIFQRRFQKVHDSIIQIIVVHTSFNFSLLLYRIVVLLLSCLECPTCFLHSRLCMYLSRLHCVDTNFAISRRLLSRATCGNTCISWMLRNSHIWRQAIKFWPSAIGITLRKILTLLHQTSAGCTMVQWHVPVTLCPLRRTFSIHTMLCRGRIRNGPLDACGLYDGQLLPELGPSLIVLCRRFSHLYFAEPFDFWARMILTWASRTSSRGIFRGRDEDELFAIPYRTINVIMSILWLWRELEGFRLLCVLTPRVFKWYSRFILSRHPRQDLGPCAVTSELDLSSFSRFSDWLWLAPVRLFSAIAACSWSRKEYLRLFLHVFLAMLSSIMCHRMTAAIIWVSASLRIAIFEMWTGDAGKRIDTFMILVMGRWLPENCAEPGRKQQKDGAVVVDGKVAGYSWFYSRVRQCTF